MKRIYISGKISGLELSEAQKKFSEAEKQLKAMLPNAEIINPMVVTPAQTNKTWEQYMIHDIKLLFDCDAIFMIANWKQSTGARIEHSIAINTKKTVIYQGNLS